MRSKLSTMTALTPSSAVPLAAQSRLRAHAVFLAAEHDQRHAFLLVAHGGVVDRHLLAVGLVLGPAAFDARQHLVLDADVGEGAAHHDLVVAAAGAVGVEVPLHDLVLAEVLAGGGVCA